MIPGDLLATATRRIATATSVLRTRVQDEARAAAHGGRNGELNARQLEAVRRIERVADRLEKTIS